MTELIEKRLFFSYNRDDASTLVRRIWEFGRGTLSVQYDEGFMIPGVNWRDQIENQIRSADAVAFIISPGSVASFRESSKLAVCAWEVRCAIRLQKNIIPVLWEETEEINLLPREIFDLHYVSFQEFRLSNFEDENSFNIAWDRLWLAMHSDEAQWTIECMQWFQMLEDWLDNGEHADFLLSEHEMKRLESFLSKTPQKCAHCMDHPEMHRFIRINRRNIVRRA